MRSHVVLALVIMGLLAACSSETGLIIKTTTSADFAEPISALRFYVGQKTVSAPLHFADSAPLEDVDLEGRDIATSPYKILLRQESEVDGPVAVAVLAYNSEGTLVGFGHLDSVEFVEGRVLEWVLEVGAVSPDVQVSDTGCLEWLLQDGDTIHVGIKGDEDCDGVVAGEGPGFDCNDSDPFQSPGIPEDCSNGVDDNCNGFADADDIVDTDDDGYVACGDQLPLDCNDDNDAVHPNAEEVCDGADNNCDNLCDEGHDADLDGISACGSVVQYDGETSQCLGMGDVDCKPGNPDVYPGNTESCDGIDNDCNGICDDDDALDTDGDGYTTCGSRVGFCGMSQFWNDCAPDDPLIHPGAHELCDNTDNDCAEPLDPGATPCFLRTTVAPIVCVEGRRNCSASGVTGVCQPLLTPNAATVPDEWCSDYESCDQDPQIADAFSCSLQIAASTGSEQRCRVRMQSPTTPCPGLTAPIETDPGSNPVDCSYSLIGGNRQDGYVIALVDPLAPNEIDRRSIQGCDASIRVLNTQSAWPDVANIPILFSDSDGTEHEIRIRLEAETVESCNGIPGLVCDATASCEQTYGMADSFDLCEEAADTCRFFVNTNEDTCTNLCASFGGACIDNYDGDCATAIGSQGCEVVHQSQVCICTRP